MDGEKPERLTVNAPFFQEIKDDHQQLQKLMAELDRLASDRPSLVSHSRRFASLIDDLVDQLALHFTLEEAYGYFEHALEEAPRFHDQASKLRCQHSDLYLMIQSIAEAAEGASRDKHDQLDQTANQYLSFQTSLKAHESAELNLIQEALNRDMGGGD